jgi:hypothetical protein
MADVHIGELPPGTKRCKICKEPINSEARKCIHCQSDQGWRSRLSVSTAMMSLLVALVSVLTVAIPVIKTLVTPENSELVFAPQGATAETISVLVSNKGIRAGSVRSGAVVLDDGALLILHIYGMAKNEPKIIEPGKTELIKLYSVAHLEEIPTPNQCTLRLVHMDFRGTRGEAQATLDCVDTKPFLSAHGPNAP